ncbi:hypothetical protein NPIL_525951 [Nephila pilipes]|uniref:Uncharacterized protein n=1 Tax=Nephila pilipes TaxID=299642 RepID=A0A8X6UAZ7_NEPPI|nr:hypothetical protein NPIL_525951 [Nephila pilipes]
MKVLVPDLILQWHSSGTSREVLSKCRPLTESFLACFYPSYRVREMGAVERTSCLVLTDSCRIHGRAMPSPSSDIIILGGGIPLGNPSRITIPEAHMSLLRLQEEALLEMKK